MDKPEKQEILDYSEWWDRVGQFYKPGPLIEGETTILRVIPSDRYVKTEYTKTANELSARLKKLLLNGKHGK